jgi:hypothetical protein
LNGRHCTVVRVRATVARWSSYQVCVPHQGVSSVGERGHRLSERRPPFLGEEFALAVKDANPRISTRNLHIELIMLGKLSIIGAVPMISQQ